MLSTLRTETEKNCLLLIQSLPLKICFAWTKTVPFRKFGRKELNKVFHSPSHFAKTYRIILQGSRSKQQVIGILKNFTLVFLNVLDCITFINAFVNTFLLTWFVLPNNI